MFFSFYYKNKSFFYKFSCVYVIGFVHLQYHPFTKEQVVANMISLLIFLGCLCVMYRILKVTFEE